MTQGNDSRAGRYTPLEAPLALETHVPVYPGSGTFSIRARAGRRLD